MFDVRKQYNCIILVQSYCKFYKLNYTCRGTIIIVMYVIYSDSTVGRSIASIYNLSAHIYLGALRLSRIYISTMDLPTVLYILHKHALGMHV